MSAGNGIPVRDITASLYERERERKISADIWGGKARTGKIYFFLKNSYKKLKSISLLIYNPLSI